MPRRALWLFALLSLATAAGAAGPKTPQVVVRPFEVYNAPDLEPLVPGLQAMLASRLAGKGYSVSTATEARPGDEDWAVRTTITRLSGVYSIDASLEPVGASGDGTRTYETADTSQGLLPALEKVANRLRDSLREVARREPAPLPAPVTQLPPAAGTASALPGETGSVTPSPNTSLAQALSNHRVGAALTGEAKSLVLADVNGDGTQEILVLLEDVIHAYRDDGREITAAWESPTPSGYDALILSAGDVDGNGLPEIFVAGEQNGSPTTQALEWFGSALAPKGDRVRGFLRAVPRPDGEVLLLGRLASAGTDLFTPDLRQFAWSSGAYRETGRFDAPAAAAPVNLDFVRLAPGQPPARVVTTQSDRLQVYDEAGVRLFETKDPVKGSRVALVGAPTGRPDISTEERLTVQSRTVGWLGPDGRSYLIIARNHSSLGGLFHRFPSFTHGQIQAYHWDGLTLALAAEGPKISGYFSDLDLGPSPGRPAGARTLYALLVQEEGTLVVEHRTRIVAYALPAPNRAAKP